MSWVILFVDYYYLQYFNIFALLIIYAHKMLFQKMEIEPYKIGDPSAQHLFVPKRYLHKDNDGEVVSEFDLTILQRIFIFLSFPNSSVLSKIYSFSMMSLICCSICILMLGSEPSNTYQPSSCNHPACNNNVSLCPNSIICPPVPLREYQIGDLVCIIIFTIDFVVRILLSGCVPTMLSNTTLYSNNSKSSKIYFSWYYQMFRYIISLQSAIDILTILPVLLNPFHSNRYKLR